MNQVFAQLWVVDNRNLIRISLISSLAGIAIIYGLSLLVEPKPISVNLLERYQGRIVQIVGTISHIRRHEAGHLFLQLKDESGKCEVPLFSNIAEKTPALSVGDRVKVIGTVEEYRDSDQVVPRTERDVVLVPTPPLSIAEAKCRIGQTVKTQGISFQVRGQTFHLVDENSTLRVHGSKDYVEEAGRELTLAGTIKRDDQGIYLRVSQILATSPRLDPVKISAIRKEDGVYLCRGRLILDSSEPKLDDRTGYLELPEGLVNEGMVQGDLVEVLLTRKGDEMNALDVSLDRANTMPFEKLNEEMVGQNVRIRGTVVSRFVSGKNMFLTIYNGTQLDVPIFGSGNQLDVQLGDVVTISGRVGEYKDKLQVVPRNISQVKVENAPISDRELEDISEDDLFTLVRTRGRISSIKRYSRSCSITLKGEEGKMRIYLTFQPHSNLSVGTEVEVIGLVKSYRGKLEMVPRNKQDIG